MIFWFKIVHIAAYFTNYVLEPDALLQCAISSMYTSIYLSKCNLKKKIEKLLHIRDERLIEGIMLRLIKQNISLFLFVVPNSKSKQLF